MIPVRITAYKIDTILENGVRRGIREYLFRLRGYSQYFDSWVPETSVKNIITYMATTSHVYVTMFINASRDTYE